MVGWNKWQAAAFKFPTFGSDSFHTSPTLCTDTLDPFILSRNPSSTTRVQPTFKMNLRSRKVQKTPPPVHLRKPTTKVSGVKCTWSQCPGLPEDGDYKHTCVDCGVHVHKLCLLAAKCMPSSPEKTRCVSCAMKQNDPSPMDVLTVEQSLANDEAQAEAILCGSPDNGEGLVGNASSFARNMAGRITLGKMLLIAHPFFHLVEKFLPTPTMQY